MSFLAAALGARVLLTDKAAECTELMRANAARNVEAVAEYTGGRGAMAWETETATTTFQISK